MRIVASLLSSLFLSSTAMAGSIQAPGVIGGPDSGPTTGNPAATMYNPAALSQAEGFQSMLDIQLANVRIDITSWRNGGFDPNTGDAYNIAKARVKAPVTFLGFSHEILEDKLTAGLGLTTPFIGGGDYTAGESIPPPYTSHQRYFGVNTKVITGQVIPAVSYTPVKDWGLHVGAGMTYTIDIIEVTKTSNTGTEGVGSQVVDGEQVVAPYTTDAVLSGRATGSHIGWNIGVLFDKYKLAQVGASYTSGGTFDTKGDATVEFPGFLVTGGEAKTLKGEVAVKLKLPPIIRAGINSQLTDALNVGVAWDHYQWNKCCGGKDGDIDIKVNDKQGNPIGESDEEVQISVAKQQYSPRRLWDASNISLFSGYQLDDRIWLGGRVGYNQNAVPDYAVGATNVDFENAGFMIGARYRLPMGTEGKRGMTMGLAYSKYFLFTRSVAGTAWGADVPDERFSPTQAPYNVSGDGVYEGKVDILGFRLGYDG